MGRLEVNADPEEILLACVHRPRGGGAYACAVERSRRANELPQNGVFL